ncbi:MAG: hypothetical protein HAW58_02935 [Candidatus Thioglobus sp.]|nr:hypothetical protein [Candidatus Thioglobus sp.]
MDMAQLETQQISIRMPKSLVAAIDKTRQGYRVSRSTAIINALSRQYESQINLDYKRKLKPSNLDNWPEVGRTPQEIADDFTIALRQIKAGEGRPIEELIAELEAMDKVDGISNN